VAHWLNILCKGGGVKWRNCYRRATLTSRICAVSYTGVYWPEKTDQRSQYLNPVEFPVWSVLQQKLYR